MKQTDLIALQHFGNVPNEPLGGAGGRLDDARQALVLGSALVNWWRRTFRRAPRPVLPAVVAWLQSPPAERSAGRALEWDWYGGQWLLVEESGADGETFSRVVFLVGPTLDDLEAQAMAYRRSARG